MSGGKKVPINEALLIPQVAAHLALGKPLTEIARLLSSSFNTVKRIASKDETKAVVAEIKSGYKEIAQAFCMKEIADMNELSMGGLRKALKDGNVQAIRTHLQVIGLIGQEEAASKQQGAGTIQVILPGAHVEAPAIEVTDVGPQEDCGNETGEAVDVGRGDSDGNDHL